jgi:hypothetical protein
MYTELIKRAALAGIAFPGIPVTPDTDKDLRIISLQPHVSNGQIRSHRSHTTLNEQLLFYPEADHDDGPDALDMLRTLAFQFGGEFKYTSAASSRSQSRSTSRRSSNNNDDDGEDDD